MTGRRHILINPHRHYAGFWTDENRLTPGNGDNTAGVKFGEALSVEIFTVPSRLIRAFSALGFRPDLWAPSGLARSEIAQNPDGYADFSTTLADYLRFINVVSGDVIRVDIRAHGIDGGGIDGDMEVEATDVEHPIASLNLSNSERGFHFRLPGEADTGAPYRIRQRPGEGIVLPRAIPAWKISEPSAAGIVLETVVAIPGNI